MPPDFENDDLPVVGFGFDGVVPSGTWLACRFHIQPQGFVAGYAGSGRRGIAGGSRGGGGVVILATLQDFETAVYLSVPVRSAWRKS